MNYSERIGNLRTRLDEEGLAAMLVTNLTNVRYLTGFSGTNGQVLVSCSGASFFSDPRYSARAADTVSGAEVVIYPTRLNDVLPDRLRAAGIDRLGFEAATVTVAERDRLASGLDAVELVACADAVERLRRSKDEEEIARIREAVRLADEAFEWVLGVLEPGRTEHEIALELEMWIRTQGADDVSFEPIVGSGPLSAHVHHTPGNRRFETGDLVLMDFGALVDGYCSDLTRTVVLGPGSDERKELYRIVLESQGRGIDAVSAGASCSGVDAVAREVIENAGHGAGFGHGLGHGVGLEIHESPSVHWTSEDDLVAGDVMTVEPGIYIPGDGGIRIEDCVLVAAQGAEVLGKAPKTELLEL